MPKNNNVILHILVEGLHDLEILFNNFNKSMERSKVALDKLGKELNKLEAQVKTKDKDTSVDHT